MYYPITLSLPGAGMIAVVGKRYETLSDEFIQQWLLDLMNGYRATPEYLLVSQEARQELHRIVMADLHMYSWASRNAMDERGEVAERYPNKITDHPLTIVVFPGLPEKTLCMASLLEMRDEQVRNEGPMRVTTRTYAGLKER